MFGVKKKKPCLSLNLLSEPSFLFDENGSFSICNDAAYDFLADMGYQPESCPESINSFMAVMRNRFDINSKQHFFHENWHYRILKTTLEGQTLIRLSYLREDESVTRLSMSLNIMPWGIMTVNLDDDQKIVFCNKKASEFLGVVSDNLIGLSVFDVFRVIESDGDISPYLHSKEPQFFDQSIKTHDKTQWCRFYFVPFMGDFRYCMIVLQDTTEEKVKEGHFFQAQRLESLGQLAGGVAHDFNNILSIIDGYARMSRKMMDQNAPYYHYIENISKAVERGAGLTGRLLTFGRHKISKDHIFDMGKLVKDQELLIKPLMDASISLNIIAQPDIYIDGTSDNLCQILFNLCINARDAMKDGGNLIVEVRKSEDGIAILEVIDTGCGMTQEVKEKMFDPFYTTKGQGKGTGLGLSMVYSLVQDMNGQIDVTTKLGAGTAIKISFPLSHKISDDITDNHTKAEGRPLNGLTALIAEDEPELLELVSGMMEDIGIHVLKAFNGNEALAVQEEYDGIIDFLLTDVVMPELNGVRLAELFSACRPQSKVMFMSGYPANGQMARVQIPDDAFLMPKPINFDNLKSVVQSLLQSGNDNQTSELKRLTGEWRVAK